MNTSQNIGELITELEEIKNLLTINNLNVHTKIEDYQENVKIGVSQVLDYTEQEKKNINEVMNRVFQLDLLLSKGIKIYATVPYSTFILMYGKLSDREKMHFEKKFIEISLIGAKEKISELLISPLKSGLDYKNIIIHIHTIMKYEPDFDFSIYSNNDLDKLVLEINKNLI